MYVNIVSDSNILGHALTGNRKEVANGYRIPPVIVTMTTVYYPI